MLKYRRQLYFVSLLFVIIGSASSYLLADSMKHTITANSGSSSIGIYTFIQYTFIGLFMLSAWYFSPKSNRLGDFKWMFIIAIIARLILIDTDSYTSNDVDRYLFDGRIAYEGYDPYSISHDHPMLADLRAQWQPPEEHAKYVTIYPPLALGLFTLAASTGVEHAQLTWELMLLAASIAIVFLSALLLQKLNRLRHIALVALSPILILEAGIGLHIDTFSTLAIVAALYAWQCNKIKLTGFIIGLGVLVKILPLMLLLPLFFLQKKLAPAFLLVFTTFTTVVVGYALTVSLGLLPVGSIGVFFEKWRFASPLFTLLDQWLPPVAIMISLGVLATILSCAIAYLCFCLRYQFSQKSDVILSAMQLAVAIPLIISPVVFPWYLMVLVPLLAIRPNIYLMAWLFVMPITYEVVSGYICCNTWMPAQWPISLLAIVYTATLIKILQVFIQQWPLLSLRQSNKAVQSVSAV